jgi:spore maturation protein CgeB
MLMIHSGTRRGEYTPVPRLDVFGLTISSSWGNGHATVYRGLLEALHARGWTITFYERDVYYYRDNRDLWTAPYCDIVLYDGEQDLRERLHAAPAADVALVGSYCPDGIAVLDWLSGGAPRRRPEVLAYYDIDTPVTLEALHRDGATTYLRGDQLARCDLVLSFTGGPALAELEERWGAPRARLLACAIDPALHYPREPDERYSCLMGYMGTYADDRQPTLQRLLFAPADRLPRDRFILAGPQYPAGSVPPHIVFYQHLAPPEHAAFYSSCTFTLNVTRAAMIRYGYAPSVRLFEAAGCGACIISDRWRGMDEFLAPGREVLLASDTEEAMALLAEHRGGGFLEIGSRARARVLHEHTHERRAAQFVAYVEEAGAR